MRDELVDGGFQFFGRAVDAASELTICEQREPAFHQVQPRGRGGREVDMEARPLGQPVLNQLGFVSAVVVPNQMQRSSAGKFAVETAQKLQELLMDGVYENRDDFCLEQIESGEQCGSCGTLRCDGAAGSGR